jgi:hypothetical protein
METVMITICITQMIVNVLLYALVLSTEEKTTRRMQKQRTELLQLIHAHQQWIEITQRGSTLQGLRNKKDPDATAGRSLLLDSKDIENAG